jgi:hypothetical protein
MIADDINMQEDGAAILHEIMRHSAFCDFGGIADDITILALLI